MDPFLQQLRATMRLHFRNRMALIYSYLFPTIFLIAFWVLYRYERVPLARHMGELLTVTALGGACFGLPTAMVSERERGVWRRYRLAPVATGTLIAGTIVARYILLVLAGILQVSLAMLIGMPLPNHPLDLWLAFTLVAFALLGLGLVIATLADNVPAVQALGQCIFLPMLIIGGVAVQLASLPEWAQHVSAFFPGRYAVEAIQACVTGNGLGAVRFSLLALVLIGAAACLAGVKMFRWDAQQRFVARTGKGWIAVAIGAWAAVGLLAESRGLTGVTETSRQAQTSPVTQPAPIDRPAGPPDVAPAPAVEQPPVSTPPAAEQSATTPPVTTPPVTAPRTTTAPPTPATQPPAPSSAPPQKPAAVETARPDSGPKPAGPAASGQPPSPSARGTAPPANSGPQEPGSWQDVTPAHIDEIVFSRLPPDTGVVSPIARADEPLDPDVEAEVEEVRSRLPTWRPALVADPVQRVRNVLYVAAVPDVFQMPIERHLPHVVFERLQADVPKDDLIKILFWVATHPMGGDDSAVDDLRSAGLRVAGPSDIEQARERVMLYALKLLGRVAGKIPD
jgi:ABC-type transport system involved in cytochrome c biogenesis permease component